MKGYDLYRYLKPVWNTDVIENETITFLGEDDEAPFLYEPTEILAVKNYRLDKEFACGVDYDIVNGKIRRKGDAIPFFKIKDYFTDDKGIYSIGVAPATVKKYGLKGEKYLSYGEGDTFTKNQIAVTYKTKEKWGGPIPPDKQEKFPVFTNKISTGERLKITFYGDSIMTGCNASGTPMGGNIPPYMDAFPVLIKEFLQGAFHADVETSNVSQGGWNTYQGLDAFSERVLPTAPDLLVLGFGMNDMHTPLDEFGNMYAEMVRRFRAVNPDGEVLAVATMWPNTDSTWVLNQIRTIDVLNELEERFGSFGVADMTTMHAYILQRKRYRDGTANNVNHPNDFIGRIYAQVILKTLLGEKFENFYETKNC